MKPHPDSNRSTKLLWAVIIVLVLGLPALALVHHVPAPLMALVCGPANPRGGVECAAGSGTAPSDSAHQPAPLPSPQPLTYILGTTIPAAWKTFHSDDLHASLKYPPTWSITIDPEAPGYHPKLTTLAGAEGLLSFPGFGSGGCDSVHVEYTWINGRLFHLCHNLTGPFPPSSELTESWHSANTTALKLPDDVVHFAAMANPGRDNARVLLEVLSTLHIDGDR